MREARISFYGPTQNSLNFFRFVVLPPSILFADRPTYSCLLKLKRKELNPRRLGAFAVIIAQGNIS